MENTMKANTRKKLSKAIGIISVTVAPFLIQEAGAAHHEHGDAEMKMEKADLTKLLAVINGVGDSEVSGTVMFEKVDDGVKVTAKISGLTSDTKHGFHVHQFGDLDSPDASSAGGHFNPGENDHALPDKMPRHAGDMGNLESDGDGNAMSEITMKGISLGTGTDGILGRAVIIHEKADDGGQPTGNAGDRIGAGVIGICKDGMGEHKKGERAKDMKAMPETPANDAEPIEMPSTSKGTMPQEPIKAGEPAPAAIAARDGLVDDKPLPVVASPSHGNASTEMIESSENLPNSERATAPQMYNPN